MSTAMKRMTFLAVAASLALVAPMAVAAESDRCAAVANSALAEPEWYAGECLDGVAPEAPVVQPGPWRVPGDLFYLHNIRGAGQFPMSVYTAPIPTYNFTLLGPNTNPIFAMDFDNAATTLYGINNTTRMLGTYNLTTGAFTPTILVTGIPAASTISSLKFDPTSTTVYVNATNQLYTIDLTTGITTLVGSYTHAAPAVIEIAISNTGQMYGTDLNDNFYIIDKTTAATTLVGPLTVLINFAQGMDFDWSDNTLYMFAYTGAGVNSLRRIDLTTGQAILILNGPLGPEHEGAVKVPGVLPVTVAPAGLAVDAAAGNGVLEPNEPAVIVAPSWENTGAGAIASLTGVANTFTGPPVATYTINDAAADYGAVAVGATASCTATGDCYSVTVTAATRPSTHWDSVLNETVTPPGADHDWTLHIGASFTDVPTSNPFYRFIEILLHQAVTSGCTTTEYCPSASTSREQMAVFALVAKEGQGYAPPACSPPNLFNDVPETSPFCRWIEELANRGVVAGCGNNNYCPADPVTREQMTVFMLRTLDDTIDPPPCSPPNLFNDVPETSPFCRWIEELANRGVVTGCGNNNYCPTDPVTREQMGVFISVTFGLTLYGV